MPSDAEIKVAAAAIANARGGRRGAPPVNNILEVLEAVAGGKLLVEVMADAAAALEAAERAREPIVFTTADGSHRFTVKGPSDIVVDRLMPPSPPSDAAVLVAAQVIADETCAGTQVPCTRGAGDPSELAEECHCVCTARRAIWLATAEQTRAAESNRGVSGVESPPPEGS
jgi:hypothetical protein